MNSALSDTDIMQATVLLPPDDKGRIDMQYTLPSGRVLQYGVRHLPNSLKARDIIAWCNGVRAEDIADMVEAEERSLRPEIPPPEPKKEEAREVADPGDLVRQTVQRLRQKMEDLREQKAALDAAMYDTNDELERWEYVAKGLGIEQA